MAKSLAAIKSQIEKLQKQADSIQSNVISRIKREIAQHGLTADDLFGAGIRSVGNGSSAQPKKAAKTKPGTIKPAKFADGAGNTWHGVGKRPGWIHEALEAGRKLEEFLIGKKAKPASAPKSEAQAAKRGATKKPNSKKAAPAKRAPAVKKAVTAKKARAKNAGKTPARKKGVNATGVAKLAGRAGSKKKPAPKAANPKAKVAVSAVEAPAQA